jgi:hypothetical protein
VFTRHRQAGSKWATRKCSRIAVFIVVQVLARPKKFGPASGRGFIRP